ncbi:sulfatase-like hydrolase/transferase [Sediminibacterium sp.]|uniref:sulfatase-like hydrolase/transferase n=1 Tax=Sediminibacterium sp. TaxID=1917865 RepID=UPI003F6A18A1
MKAKICFSILFSWLFIYTSHATNYYINAETGKDSNKGTGAKQAFQTINPVNTIQLKPGDSVLFAAGQQFTGMLSIRDARGSQQQPIVIASYDFKGSKTKPIIDAGKDLNAILIQNSSHIKVQGLELTGKTPYFSQDSIQQSLLRCGVLVEVTKNESYENIQLTDLLVHDVYYHQPGFTRSAAETKSANGTQSYGWGIRFINNTKQGKLSNIKVLRATIQNVSHTGLKATANRNGIINLEIANCKVSNTGGPGMQFSGVTKAHIHHNQIAYSGSTTDSRNWGRGSGLWTWSCADFIIEHNRFENANGPGDSAGVHIDYNCNDIIIQYNLSANNAGGFCEILGNNFNCAYRYNVSINDGHRTKGVNGAFQEGKTFWLSGYVGDQKKNAGPYNSYFYNNTIYVGKHIQPKIAASSSSDGVLIANNIFYFETDPITVAGDQKKKEVDVDGIPNVLFKNNLFLQTGSWPSDFPFKDASPIYGNPRYAKNGGVEIADYTPLNRSLVANKGIEIPIIPNDSIGLKVGLKVNNDILGNPIVGLPDMGAIELKEPSKLQPNVILIVTDDQGYADVGFNGSKDISTPNIDRIAKNGVVFTQGYVSYSVCAPSRAGIMTGRYQDRFGYSRNPLYRPFDEGIGLPLSEQTLPEYLQQVGYNTMGIGKWHLGVHEQFRPWNRGFNQFFGFLGGGHRYFPSEFNIAHPDSAKNEGESYRTKLVRNNQVVEETDYLTDVLSREAVNYIEENKAQPFFLYLAYNAPHTPLQATQKYLDRFPNIQDAKRKTYAAMVSAVDDGVGAVLNKLEELKIAENTIVVFISDNGGPESDNSSNNGVLRAGKGSLFEGGIRVPFAMQWPKAIKPNSKYNKPVISLDIFATIAASIPSAPKTKNPLDGVNLIPYLNSQQSASPHEYLFWRHFDQKNYAVLHQSGMKEMILRDSSFQLYDLQKDIGEEKNIQEQQKQWISIFETQRKKWESQTIAPIFLGLNQEAQYNQLKKGQKNK